MKEKITPCLWFDGQAVEAADLYCSVFSDARITSQSPMVTEIQVAGQSMILLDGGPKYKPNASISFFYTCENEAAFDRIWNAFLKGGTVRQNAEKDPFGGKFGWINDRYGISWQLAVGKFDDLGQRITPCLLFTGKQYGRADEAIAHYSEVFAHVDVVGVFRYADGELPNEKGKVQQAIIKINGNPLLLMDDAKPDNLMFTEGVSLTVYCDTQEEIDFLWEKLTEGGAESMCGWLRDRFGVSWQIIPSVLGRIMSDPQKAGKAAQVFMSMRKLNIEQIVQASLS